MTEWPRKVYSNPPYTSHNSQQCKSDSKHLWNNSTPLSPVRKLWWWLQRSYCLLRKLMVRSPKHIYSKRNNVYSTVIYCHYYRVANYYRIKEIKSHESTAKTESFQGFSIFTEWERNRRILRQSRKLGWKAALRGRNPKQMWMKLRLIL